MSKYDNELNRMLFLMEDKKPSMSVQSNIVYHAEGADGKAYGIIKEGTKYYIKTAEKGKENLLESYDYIGGITGRRQNEYKSFNDATKHLEIKLISLNEAYGTHNDVSVVDMDRSKKVFANLTEDARKELDRMNRIFENSCCIGKGCACMENPESKGKSTGADTVKNNEPFEEKVTVNMEFKGKETTPANANDYQGVKNVDNDLQSDKMKTANSGSEKDYKDAHDDLDGESVADKKPSGGKAVMVNEGMFEGEYDDMDSFIGDEEIEPEMNDADAMGNDFELSDMSQSNGDEIDDMDANPMDNAEAGEEGIVGTEEDDDLGSLLEELEANLANATKDLIAGPEDTLDGPNPKGGNGVDGETGPEWKRVEESEEGNVNEPTKQGDEETMKSYQGKGNLPVQSWDKMDEAISRVAESVYNKIKNKKVVKESAEDKIRRIVKEEMAKMNTHKQPKRTNESIEDKINRIVKEEVTKLNVWGQHPKYGKEPMTLPDNKEVFAGTADRDFNDDSAKGSERYGKKIGDGKPFDKAVEMLTDQVLSQLKESMKKGKKVKK